MYITSRLPSKRTPIRDSQARYLAERIRSLEHAFRRHFDKPYNADAGDSARFWALPEYDLFHDAAYACGFVCADLTPNYSLESANIRPFELIGQESLNGLRHYLHTLLRAERSNRMDGYFSPICAAIESGALSVVAQRLESDPSLCEPHSSIPGDSDEG